MTRYIYSSSSTMPCKKGNNILYRTQWNSALNHPRKRVLALSFVRKSRQPPYKTTTLIHTHIYIDINYHMYVMCVISKSIPESIISRYFYRYINTHTSSSHIRPSSYCIYDIMGQFVRDFMGWSMGSWAPLQLPQWSTC